jgi:alkanesulfonate monooxygenase
MSFETHTTPDVYWFIPTGGDGRYLGSPSRPNSFQYLSSVAQAADTLGFDGVLLPTGGYCEDAWVLASALVSVTKQLRFLVAARPGLISPVLAARMTASLDRISNGRVNLNIVTGSGKHDLEGLPHSHDERYLITEEWLNVFRDLLRGETVSSNGNYIKVENARQIFPSVQHPYPPIYFGGSSEPARDIAAEYVDVYLSWGERPEEVAEKINDVREKAKLRGRKVRFGLRAHIIVRESEDEAWQAADDLIKNLSEEEIAKAQAAFIASESVGQQRMVRLNNGSRDSLRIGKNLWAGVGLVRGGAGTAFVGDPGNIALALREYQDLGIDTFILSSYPHLEEAYRTAELLFPVLGKTSPMFAPVSQPSKPAQPRETVGRFASI